MTDIYPVGVPVFGNQNVRWVASIADLSAPTLEEITAAAPASLGLPGYMIAETWVPGMDTARQTSQRRLGEKNQFERFGPTSLTLEDIQISFDPQAAAGSDEKLAFETLSGNKTGYFVERLGVDVDTAWEVGQFVNIHPVTLGTVRPYTPTDDGAEFTAMIPVAYNANRVDNVAIVAAGS